MKASASLSAVLKIIGDVIAFRLRKLEMANLAGAVAIMLALRLPLTELVWRFVFAALLNVFVYLNNDYLDIALDQRAPDKDHRKVSFMQDHLRAAQVAQAVLFALLLASAVAHSPGLLLTLLGGAGLCVAYSAWLKHRALVDVIAMALWGFVMPLSGSPLHSVLGICLAAQLGLMSSVFETIQVVRDHDADARQGVRTTAVVLGLRRSVGLARVAMLAASLYGALVLHPVAGVVSACALVLPWVPERTEAYWTRVKLVYGAAWLWACASVFFAGKTQGLLLSIDREATLSLLSWTQ